MYVQYFNCKIQWNNGHTWLAICVTNLKITLSLSSTAPPTNMRSRAPPTRPLWPLLNWASKAISETTSAPEPTNLAQTPTRSTCVSAVGWLLSGPSSALWPRSSSWWPSSSSMRRGESPMRSPTVRTPCCLHRYILHQLFFFVFRPTLALCDKTLPSHSFQWDHCVDTVWESSGKNKKRKKGAPWHISLSSHIALHLSVKCVQGRTTWIG